LKDKMNDDGIIPSDGNGNGNGNGGARVVTSPRVTIDQSSHQYGYQTPSSAASGYDSGYHHYNNDNNNGNNGNAYSYNYLSSPPAASDRLPILPGHRRRADST
jgi:hypothetical protein